MQIEELKAKHDRAEQQIFLLEEDMHSQKQLIEEQHRTIQVLEARFEEADRKRTTAENSMARTLEVEREKQKHKHLDLLNELEELKKENKAKDLMAFEMEDVIEHLKKQQKEQISLERKRVVGEWEDKLRNASQEIASKAKES